MSNDQGWPPCNGPSDAGVRRAQGSIRSQALALHVAPSGRLLHLVNQHMSCQGQGAGYGEIAGRAVGRHDTSSVNMTSQSLCLFPSLCDGVSNLHPSGLLEGTNKTVGIEKLCMLWCRK